MSVLWYATRATGEVALLFLTIVLALGVMSALRVGGRRVPRFVIAGLHRNLTLAGLGFLAVHILTTLADSYAPVSAVDAVVPFASAYRPIWLGLGALAFDMLLVLTVTSLLRTRIGFRWWKALHWAAYACWVIALVHALGTGSDVRTSTFLFFAGICCALVLAAMGWRLAEGGQDNQAFRLGAGLTALIVVIGIGAWTVRGPLEPGWAKRSGTPASLLPKPAAVTPHATGAPTEGDGG
jgi:sulfoxide reductase heme-binding subunit YedZ